MPPEKTIGEQNKEIRARARALESIGEVDRGVELSQELPK